MDKNIFLDKKQSTVYHEVDGLSLQNLFYVKNGSFPNCYMFTRSPKSGGASFNAPGILNRIKELPEYKNGEVSTTVYTNYNMDTKEEKIGFSVIFSERNLFARFEDSIMDSYILYGSNNSENVKWLIDLITPFYIRERLDKNNIFLISQGATGFSLTKWSINEVPDFDIKKQYNDDFQENSRIIKDFISSDNKSGLVILHGEKGTGKSTYIRHLVNTNHDKKFIFIHSGLVNMLGDPSFNNFLLSLSDSVIIIEDCEDAIKSRKSSGSSAAVGILLNMTDGLLADNLHIKFICTFNEDISNIDEALLRKGRLVCKYEFDKLEKEKSNQLLKELYGDENITTDKKMSLADIYNYHDASFEKNKSKFI